VSTQTHCEERTLLRSHRQRQGNEGGRACEVLESSTTIRLTHPRNSSDRADTEGGEHAAGATALGAQARPRKNMKPRASPLTNPTPFEAYSDASEGTQNSSRTSRQKSIATEKRRD